MHEYNGWPVPADVERHTAHLVESGVAAFVSPGLQVDGELDELLFWCAVQIVGKCSTLSICVQRKDGGSGNGVVPSVAIQVVCNHVGDPRPVKIAGRVLSLEQLRLLEVLAVGLEEFNLQPGLRLRRTAEPIPGYCGSPMREGEVFEIEAVHFTQVYFGSLYAVPRHQVNSTYFTVCM